MATVILSNVEGLDEPQVWQHLDDPTPLLIVPPRQVFRLIAWADNGPDGDELVYFYEPA